MVEKIKNIFIASIQRCKRFCKVRSASNENTWQLAVNNFRNQCQFKMQSLKPYERWNWAFSILLKLNKIYPFELLERVIPDIVYIHNDDFNDELTAVLKDDILQAKYEYGFTISEMGEFAELLANNEYLTFDQSLQVIEHIVNIGNYNYSNSIESWEEYFKDLNIAFDNIH
ncbi:hypothetical protein [Psychrobacter lutiphocae]|uniref:hypothetical protein n=1 Tax=Psychrobacter lutiphocae TaxID=540500 RepID=UPI000361B53A|nr:hypothetical protein [Psychrobacter lutiphocae]